MNDYVVMIAIVSVVSGFGIYEGIELHPAFYSQSAVIWIMFGYCVIADRRSKKQPKPVSVG